MKIIHCSVWGDIELSDLAINIIDTIHFQRLHYIKQTGFAYKVFPTATSSRFEHSIGVYHVTKTFLQEIAKKQPDVMPSARTVELLCITGLVHDLGHGPFSHLFDEYLKQSFGSSPSPWSLHEYRSIVLFKDLVRVYRIPLSEDEVEFITQRIHQPPTTHWYDTLVCNPISCLDTDKMDYVVRDSLHFGMKFHTDILRILRNARVIQNCICYCERIHDEIDLFFQIRQRMQQRIYRHPKIKYFEEHLLEQLTSSAYRPPHTLQEFLTINDGTLLQSLCPLQWSVVETRKAPSLHSPNDSTPPYIDDQWNRATQNILYYKRKDPTYSFTILSYQVK